MSLPNRLIITPGEPAGIGPDVTINVAQTPHDQQLVVVADPDVLLQRAHALNLPLELIECDIDAAPKAHEPGTLTILPIKTQVKVKPQELAVENAAYVLATLDKAATLCEEGKAKALVTGPVHKGILNNAGIPFSGHTEFLAMHANVKHTVMLFVVDKLKIAIATTHLPLADVPQAITESHLQATLIVLHQGLIQYFKIADPKILVCGLNPHAGESGHLGREEIDIIAPVLKRLNDAKMKLKGPLSADTVFTEKVLHEGDAVLAMYHDQALPVVKYVGFDRAVNMTLGLPYLRTSVDHGTALELAGTGEASAGSLAAAIRLAAESF